MRASGKRSESAFWVGVLTMFGSQLAVKLLGLLYRLVITNIEGFGDVGNGYYSAGFQIYTLLLALSSVGIPSAQELSQEAVRLMGVLSKGDSILNLPLPPVI